jgi:hypothetical protein
MSRDMRAAGCIRRLSLFKINPDDKDTFQASPVSSPGWHLECITKTSPEFLQQTSRRPPDLNGELMCRKISFN